MPVSEPPARRRLGTHVSTRETIVTGKPIADLRAALQQAVAELSFEAGRQAATDPERAADLMAAAATTEETLQRTATTRP